MRHLLYHVLPVRGNGVWQRNLEQLRQRLALFNGRRVIAVVRGPACDPPEAVQEFFRGHRIDWVVMDNDPRLREVTTWHALWSRVETQAPNQYTFYAHAKGVTRPVNPGVTCHPWARLLYIVCLDYWPLVEETLAQYPLAGALKKVGQGFTGSSSSWHYSGSFFWARNADVFARNWRYIDQVWWGIESWPGVHFRPDEAGCLFHEGTVPTLDMYNMRYLRNIVEPEFEKWKLQQRKYLSVTGSATTSSPG